MNLKSTLHLQRALLCRAEEQHTDVPDDKRPGPLARGNGSKYEPG